MTDRPIENPLFYTDSAERCQAWIDDLTAQAAPPQDPSDVLAGIVPHAGWSYSGAVAAQGWKHLQVRSKPEVIIIFGAVHYPGAPRNAAYPGGAWSSPLGPVPVDGNLADTLRKQLDSLLDVDASAHAQELSIEVQIPFVRALFPDTRILPIAVPPGSQSAALGTRVAEVTTALPVIAVGSPALTHYGDRDRVAPAGGCSPTTDACSISWYRSNRTPWSRRPVSTETRAGQEPSQQLWPSRDNAGGAMESYCAIPRVTTWRANPPRHSTWRWGTREWCFESTLTSSKSARPYQKQSAPPPPP